MKCFVVHSMTPSSQEEGHASRGEEFMSIPQGLVFEEHKFWEGRCVRCGQEETK